ncbi:MAG: hypothetical protein LBB53_06190 [Prevotellaceae bacterium]|jgi:hypothetical protein|nr:hypothetical protein [Prevotellaceae bacterium]
MNCEAIELNDLIRCGNCRYSATQFGVMYCLLTDNWEIREDFDSCEKFKFNAE